MDSCDKIVIFGQTVQVPPNRVAYNAIRMDFIRMANEAAVQYEKLYKQDGSIQKVINGLGEQMHDCLAPTLDHCITTLIHHGVIDIDVQTFAERYQSFAEPCAEAFNDVYGSGCLGCGYDQKSCYSGCITVTDDDDNSSTSVFYGNTDDGSHILTIGGDNNGCVKSGNWPLDSLRDAEVFSGIN